jgi:hypothetical protein
VSTITTQDEIRLDAWRGVFEKTNRILSEQKVTVQIVPSDRLPQGMADVAGWTDGLDIHLNGEEIRKMLRQNDSLSAVLRLKGLNYHELCHVLFTPRMTDDFVRRVVEKATQSGDRKWWYAFNALEDQRIETWFTATYGSSRRYFEAVILEWIIKNGNAEAAILVYGRKYLSPRIRVQAGRVFRKKYGSVPINGVPMDLYEEFKTVIDEYITLVLPTDAVRAFECVRRFHELLVIMQTAHAAQLPPLVINDNGMHDHGKAAPGRGDDCVPRQGRIMVKQARKARDKAEDMADEAMDADAEEEERREREGREAKPEKGSGDKADDGQQGDGDAGDQDQQPQDGGQDSSTGQGDGDADQGQSAAGDSQGQEADAEGDGESDGDGRSFAQGDTDGGGQGAGLGDAEVNPQNGDDDRTLQDEMKDLVEDAYDDMDEVREDEWVQEDVGNILDAVRAIEHNGRMEAQGAEARRNVQTPSESAKLAARRVQNILTRIRQEAEPETLKRQVHGRVDIRRALTRQAHEVDMFKQWDSGSEEETGMEAVVLVDCSISMGDMTDASEAMWALKRAFDKLDIRTTVLLYNTDHLVLFQPSDRANPAGVPKVNANGGTDPTSALQQARRILTKSQQPNKVLITVTDGQWQSNDHEVRKIMKAIHRGGATSMLLGLDNARERYGKHHHVEAHDMRTIHDLPRAALKLVGGIMRAKVA